MSVHRPSNGALREVVPGGDGAPGFAPPFAPPFAPCLAPRSTPRVAPRLALGVALGVAVAATLTLLAGCGGGSPDAPPPAAEDGTLATAASGQLVSHVQSVLREREKRRLNGMPMADGAFTVAVPGAAVTTPRSGTLVQEQGVDEPDLLKTDGTHLYSLRGDGRAVQLQSHRRAPDGSLTRRAAIALDSGAASQVGPSGLLLAADERSGVVLTQRWTPVVVDLDCPGGCAPAPGITPPPLAQKSTVGVHRVTFADGEPQASTRLEIDGTHVASRRSGDRLVVVTLHRPSLRLDVLPATATAIEREAAIATLGAGELLPTVRRDGAAARPLMSETECWVQPGNASLAVEITSITVIDLASPTLAHTSRCFVGGTEALYMTPEALYLATTRYEYRGGFALDWLYPPDMRTDIHKFALGAAVAYRGSASVEGHLGWDNDRKSYRLSEHAGDLRVVTFTGSFGWATLADADSGSKPASPARLTVLRERSGSATLDTVATLPNERRPEPLGKPGEQLYGVRFIGTRGYLVTFRFVDPLYVVDLADPADPKVVGTLEVPGVSDHLVPVADGLLLGVGRAADAQGMAQGVKVSLLDVRDPARPLELAQRVFGGRGSASGLDFSRHGLNLLQQGDVVRVAMPLLLTGDGATWTDGLQKLEVDVAARTLGVGALAGARSAASWPDIGTQRSLQVGDHAYHLRDGDLTAYGW